MSHPTDFPDHPQPIALSLEDEWHRTWLLWFVLHWLAQKAGIERELYVLASQVREELVVRIPGPDSPKKRTLTDGIFGCLAHTFAIQRTNLEGNRARRYYITKVGLAMLCEYDQFLSEREADAPASVYQVPKQSRTRKK